MGKSPNEPEMYLLPEEDPSGDFANRRGDSFLRAVGVPFDALRSVAARRLVRARKIPAGVLLNAEKDLWLAGRPAHSSTPSWFQLDFLPFETNLLRFQRAAVKKLRNQIRSGQMNRMGK